MVQVWPSRQLGLRHPSKTHEKGHLELAFVDGDCLERAENLQHLGIRSVSHCHAAIVTIRKQFGL